jgi:hypothetical protein
MKGLLDGEVVIGGGGVVGVNTSVPLEPAILIKLDLGPSKQMFGKACSVSSCPPS